MATTQAALQSPSLKVFVAVFLALTPLQAVASQEEVVRIEIEGLAGPSLAVSSINNHGAIVGAISPAPGSPSVPFVWTATRGTEFFLGSSPGRATAISDSGAIVGFLDDAAANTFSGFLWTRQNGVVDLGSFLPLAINTHNRIAGECAEDPGRPRPCVWENGAVTELGNGLLSGGGFDINERGDVAGQCGPCGQGGFSAVVWSRRAEVTPLPTSTGAAEAISAAMAINPRREVVGFETEAGGTVVINPVRWTPAGEIQTFPQFRGTFVAINSSGLAVGRYEVQIEPNRFDWNVFVSIRQGRVVTLGPGIPVAVNDRGAIVGTTEIEGVTQAVLWFVRP